MTSRRRHRRAMTLAVVAVVLAGCAHDAGSEPSSTAAPSTAPVTDALDDPGGSAGQLPPGSADPPASSAVVDAIGDGPAATLEVSGGDLPPSVTGAYTSNGGDLITPEEWRRRFGESHLPAVAGPGVMLVEATQRVERRDGAWLRTDEASWLAMSNQGRDAILTELAEAAAADGEPTRTPSNIQGADCVVDSYPVSSGDVEWTVQGCVYENFPRMVAIGISRSATTDAPPPDAADPTVAPIVVALDGTITFSEVKLGAPGPDGATLHLSTQVSTAAGVDAASIAVTTGPLAGWQTFPGEGSLLLSGPTGATWTLSDHVAVFTWAGRW